MYARVEVRGLPYIPASAFVFYRNDKPFAILPVLVEISLWDQKLLVEKDRAD